MTAIVAYLNTSTEEKISLIAADNLEGNSQTKVDKLSKINNRFTIGIVGLQAVHWAIDEGITYLNNFDNTKLNFETIEDLENELTDIILFAFARWSEAKVFPTMREQKDHSSLIIVMDCIEKCIYYCDIGKVWELQSIPDWKVEFNKINDNGLYVFGIPALGKDFIFSDYNETNLATIQKNISNKFAQYAKENKTSVGQYGCSQISINNLHRINTGFQSSIDYINNQIILREYGNRQPKKDSSI